MKRITLIILSILTLSAAARAQEGPFSITLTGGKGPLSHAAGAGVWQGRTDTGEPVSGLTLNYVSRHFLLDADLTLDGGVRNFHVGPFLIPQAAIRTEKGFTGSLRLYPTLGVTDIHDRDCRFDYGISLALTAGRKTGITVLERITAETRALTLNIAF